MSPRAGGESDKIGNRYESAWTVHHLLLVLEGTFDSIRVEDPTLLGEGSEFTARKKDAVELHQVKRQLGGAASWTIRRLQSLGVLQSASDHVTRGSDFHFVSMTPAPVLRELADRASQSQNLDQYRSELLDGEGIREDFDELCRAFQSPQTAWQTLQGLQVRILDERQVQNQNEALASLLIRGAERAAMTASLSALISNNLTKLLDRPTIEAQMEKYGLTRAEIYGNPSIGSAVGTILTGWQEGVRRELLLPEIFRNETAEIIQHLSDGKQLVMVTGAAGGGKSAVLHQAVAQAVNAGYTALAFRLDRVEAFSSTRELGQRLGLEYSPAVALSAAANGRPCLLIIDQLDAISSISGRLPRSIDAIAELIQEASGFPKMTILLACRQFDLESDHRIRQLLDSVDESRVDVAELTIDQAKDAAAAMGVDTGQLSPRQLEILTSPFNLVLLSVIATQQEVVVFASADGLLNAFWERKRRDCAERRPQRQVRFDATLGIIARAISADQRLSASIAVLDEDDAADDAEVLVSERVLVRDGSRIAFFHESFFDYVFARQWTRSGETLVSFLVAGEQELFRRAQVRQILNHLRREKPKRFIRDVKELLTNTAIRFHVKEVVLAVLRSVADPTRAEWSMVRRVLDTEPAFAGRLWTSLLTLPWFARLDQEGLVERWLVGSTSDQVVALALMRAAVSDSPDRVAELLNPHARRTASYQTWLRGLSVAAPISKSRPFFDLILDAVRRGKFNEHEQDLWLATHGLEDQQPAWGIEILAAWLRERPGALSLSDDGRVAALATRRSDFGRTNALALCGAEQEPLLFIETFLPYIFDVMSLTQYGPKEPPIHSRHFAHRSLGGPHGFEDLDDALLRGAAIALARLITQDHAAIQPTLNQLESDNHDAAQRLLYEALRSGGTSYAQEAARILVRGTHRLMCGRETTDDVWVTRELIQAISPHITAESFSELEAAAVRLLPVWEGRSRGRCSFTLLSALSEPRLSESGRRRLGELRRKFGGEQPDPPQGPVSGIVTSPIATSATQVMTDDQWLRAMEKYDSYETNGDALSGGARELAQELQAGTVSEPIRFAHLAQRLTTEVHPAYPQAILWGLQEATSAIDTELVFETIRYVAALGQTENDRALGWALRPHVSGRVPDDIVHLLLDRAVNSSDTHPDTWLKMDQVLESSDRIFQEGINTTRGSLAQVLGDVLLHDCDGHLTSLVAPSLPQLASDPSLAVRACVGHLIAACLRHARPIAVAAFETLIQADDLLLATPPVERLLFYLGNGDPAVIEPVIARMLTCRYPHVRTSGGYLAAYAAAELSLGGLTILAAHSDVDVRVGVARSCAQRIPIASDVSITAEALIQCMNDPAAAVRKAASEVAAALRGKFLVPFTDVLSALIDSPAFEHAQLQLTFTLEEAPDRVGDLIHKMACQLVEVLSADVANVATDAWAGADRVGGLVLKAYAQAESDIERRSALDLLDGLLLHGAGRVADLVAAAER
jgi:hypothetical protein